MRTIVQAGIWIAFTACAPDHPPLPPPPVDAVTSCRSEQSPPADVSTSTLWRDAAGRVIRVDGTWPEQSGDSYPIAYTFGYDDQDRLAGTRYQNHDLRYDYAPDRVVETDHDKDSWLWNLVDGRVSHEEGPPGVPSLMQNDVDYEYDASGRISRRFGGVLYDDGHGWMKGGFDRHYTYDAQDRVTMVVDGDRTTTWTYTDSATQLVIQIDQSDGIQTTPYLLLTYDFDASHRIVRAAFDQSGDETVTTYTYLDGELDAAVSGTSVRPFSVRAVGTCDPPSLLLAPLSRLPLTWSAIYVHTPNLAYEQLEFEL
jgi:YD repeat-containing protein